ncbi:H+ Antiporter protein [Moraxella cuniculi]|uniref:H+ Antiporter protein n=1 Tax=Moraxella cuniculi TaxID=34061 RepID=A0A3S5EFU8_9GAMM|nr:H+ Antiporter protein [Moraxella cuniculi]
MVYRFANLFLGEFIQKIIPLLIYIQTDSLTWLGISFASIWLPRVICQPFFGVIIDKFDIKSIFISTDFVRAMIILPLFWLDNPYMLSVIGAVFGLLAGLSYMGIEYAITHALDINRTPSTQAKIQNAEQLAMILAPIAAGFVAGGGQLLAFSLVIIGYIIMPLWFIKSLKAHDKPIGSFLLARLKSGFGEVLFGKQLLSLALVTALINLAEGVLFAILPAIIMGQFNQSSQMVGFVIALGSAISIVVLSILSLSPKIKPTLCYYLGLGLIGTGVLLFGQPQSLWLCVAGYGLLIVGRVIFVVYMRIHRAALIKPENFSTTMGVFLSLILLPMPLSGGIVAWLDEPNSITVISYLLAAIFFGIVVLSAMKKGANHADSHHR